MDTNQPTDWEGQQQARKNAENFLKSDCPARVATWQEAWRRGAVKSASSKWSAVYKQIEDGLCDTGMTFALVSNQRGTGKTTLATAAAFYTCEQGRRAIYLRTAFLVARIKATYHRDAKETEHTVSRNLLRPQLLILDEFGERSASEWEAQLLTNLVCARHDEGLDTILIANLDANTLTKAVGESVADRMREAGGIINFPWSSFRAQPMRRKADLP